MVIDATNSWLNSEASTCKDYLQVHRRYRRNRAWADSAAGV